MIEIYNEIKVEPSVDVITRQLRNLIDSGQLRTGDRLPPERKLAEKFGVGRFMVRDAIRKLEFYGMVKTHPQSGTRVRGMGMLAFEGFMTDVLNIEETDLDSLVDTRVVLEIEAAGQAALRRTEDDIVKIQKALKKFENAIAKGDSADKEDFLLHLAIAEVSGNKVLKLLMRVITPNTIKKFNKGFVRNKNKARAVVKEHREIVEMIIAQNYSEARKAMKHHLNEA